MPHAADSIVLDSVTADPGTPVEGQIWHRSDLNEIRQYLNATTVTVATTAGTTDLDDHSARHDPGGADALTTAAPSGSINGDGTNTEGAAASMARSDHGHDVDTANGTISTIQPDDAASEGVGTGLSRRDHQHAIVAAAPAQGIGAGNSEGTATSFSRSDHDHTVRESGGQDLTMGAVADGQVLTRSGTTIAGAAADPSSSIAEANGDITTTSTTDTLATGMTITPASGTYLVWFSSSISNSDNNTQMWASIYSGGTQVSGSERELMRGASQGNVTSGFSCMAKVTVNGAQAIEGRWRVSAGTGTMESGRSLVILKVA